MNVLLQMIEWTFLSPSQMTTIYYQQIMSQWGALWVGEIWISKVSKGVCYLGFAQENQSPLLELKQRFPQAELICCTAQEPLFWAQELQDYFLNERSIQSPIPCVLVGTEFQQKVWKALCQIPTGKTSSYAQIAQNIGAPKAFRAVGTAVGKNPISILIPCHRILLKNGDLGQYHWGVHLKKQLLEFEKAL